MERGLWSCSAVHGEPAFGNAAAGKVAAGSLVAAHEAARRRKAAEVVACTGVIGWCKAVAGWWVDGR